ncbi:sensor domain-containing diguanylate cyclase [Neorhizobium sp. P12A]|uniref:GGDEF domain-containing protein n=1 Tax=Neorhizobium sp. P12A TaxID=2268027 RepID=UPI0011EC4AFB|nr:sensor domain-containing diguanylate cyclase [Neorhizobium sp. P12A]KAA0699381.1 sensor domain-containing diguanylate cyclase [Neorhizobium sp. P12A]
MMLDYNSLLIALGVSATCLAFTLMGSWFARRPETFLLTCTGGLFLVVAGIFTYSFYVAWPIRFVGSMTFVMFMVGFSIIWAAGYQFRKGHLSRWRILLGSFAGMFATLPAMVAGYDGLAFMGDNIVIATLLFATAREYWLSRNEAPAPLYGISALYALTAITFVMCAAVLISDGKLVLRHAPDNWAEDISLAVCIAGMTGIGALSLALHQWRQAARHRVEANTDPLTGLLNRRALFDLYGQRAFTSSMAVVVFDIDRFKAVNDHYGHATGDAILKFFADELSRNLRASDVVARMGGEEFALVLEEILPGRAEQVAERVRSGFAAREMVVDGKLLKCTVSAGIAIGSSDRLAFDNVLNSADKALYAAKRAGRNRVELADFLYSVPPEPSRIVS